MSASGQLGISYTYDNANRLTRITQGTAVATIAYDSANRRAAVTLPNGVVQTYGYNAASDLTNLTWTKNGNPLGNLTYTYDQYGRMTQMGGTLARENLPAALSSASYNPANQLTQWGGSTLTYDLNGNLTSDGTHTYTWNARNQLAGGYLQYDALGRRTRNPAGTSFLYDGLNPIQELSGSTETANLLTGLGIDEIFSRTDSSGTFSFLTDRLGSTAALSDSTGKLQTTCATGHLLSATQGLNHFLSAARQAAAEIIILDPLYSAHDQDENDTRAMAALCQSLLRLREASRAALIMVHHVRKSVGRYEIGSAFRGSSALHAVGAAHRMFQAHRAVGHHRGLPAGLDRAGRRPLPSAAVAAAIDIDRSARGRARADAQGRCDGAGSEEIG